MKQSKLFVLLFTFLLVFGVMNSTDEKTLLFHEDVEKVTSTREMLPAYTSHDVINIVNDTDFIWHAVNESWPGDGSEDYPYIIQGYDIANDTTISIYIRDVSIHFVIRSCRITSTIIQMTGGIHLDNVTNCHLENCIITHKQVGLYATHCNGLSAINCTIDSNEHSSLVDNSNHTSFVRCHFTKSNSGSGIGLQDSQWALVSGCHLEANEYYGLVSTRSDYVNLTGNTAVGNVLGGGLSIYDSDYSNVHNNTIFQNSLDGIVIHDLEFCNVTNNLVYNNSERGIFVHNADDVLLSHNIVYENDHYGLYLFDTDRSSIYYNDFAWNPVNAYDHQTTVCINHWDHGTVGNWWSDYGGTGPYTIGGTVNPQDSYPSNSLVLIPISDRQYELGSIDNTLVVGARALNPWCYEVCVDAGENVTEIWNGDLIHLDIDGFDVGVFNLTVEIFHISGHSLSQSATVTVVDTTAPEWVLIPSDQTLVYNEELNYEVQVTDFSEIAEWIVNDTIHFRISEGVITNGTILDMGDYWLNITVTDIYDNARSIIIRIRVLPISAPIIGLTELFLIVAGVGAGLVIIAFVIIMKKKSG